MSMDRSGSRPSQSRVPPGLALLVAATLGFVLLTGLNPFDFRFTAPASVSPFRWLAARTDFAPSDLVSNLFLYVPVGAVFQWTLSSVLQRRFVSLILATGAAGLLSLSIETAQVYSPSRVPSVADLVCNTLGAAVGASAALATLWIGPHLRAAALAELRARPQAVLCKAYAAVLVILALLPFSISFDPGLLRKSVRSINLVPFASVALQSPGTHGVSLAPDEHQRLLAEWSRLKLWSGWTAEAASFLLLALLVTSVFRGDYGFGGLTSIVLTVWVGTGLAIGLSLAQIPVITRDVDVTDVLFRIFGLFVGVAVRRRHGRNHRQLAEDDPRPFSRRAQQTLLACVAAYILYTGLIPLRFDSAGADGSFFRGRVEWLPFHGYYLTRFDWMVEDLAEKMVAFGLLGGLIGLAVRRARQGSTSRSAWAAAAAATAFSLPIELTQAFSPVRVASVTDLLLAGCAAAAGVLLFEKASTVWRSCTLKRVQTESFDVHPLPQGRERFPSDLTLTDALIDNLTRVDPRAPREVAPTPAAKPQPRP